MYNEYKLKINMVTDSTSEWPIVFIATANSRVLTNDYIHHKIKVVHQLSHP